MKSPATKSDLLRRLPRERLVLLRELGNLADERDVSLYLVGGVVRDLLLNRGNWDLDLTVEGDGIAFARSVAAQYKAGLVLFERFGTGRLVLPNGQKIDIASTRRESYANPAALPEVKPSFLREDLYRRDFTINAMAIQLNPARFGWLHDPYGGQRDLHSKTLRVLHERSFRDDPTRIFRAIRFMQRFRFCLEPATRRLLTEAAATNLIRRLSGPRLCNEILLLLGEHHPDSAIWCLAQLKLLRFLHPRLLYTTEVKRLVAFLPQALAWWRKQNLSQIDRPLIYLMALLSKSGSSVIRSVTQRLQLSSAQCNAVEQSGRQADRIVEALSRRNEMLPSRVYRLLTGLPEEVIVLLAAKSQMLAGGRGVQRCKRRLARYMKQDRHVSTIVKGDDLTRLGLKPGPQYKKILDRLLNARLDGKVTTETSERELAGRMVKRIVGGSSALLPE